jgi:hypothetical protein
MCKLDLLAQTCDVIMKRGRRADTSCWCALQHSFARKQMFRMPKCCAICLDYLGKWHTDYLRISIALHAGTYVTVLHVNTVQ